MTPGRQPVAGQQSGDRTLPRVPRSRADCARALPSRCERSRPRSQSGRVSSFTTKRARSTKLPCRGRVETEIRRFRLQTRAVLSAARGHEEGREPAEPDVEHAPLMPTRDVHGRPPNSVHTRVSLFAPAVAMRQAVRAERCPLHPRRMRQRGEKPPGSVDDGRSRAAGDDEPAAERPRGDVSGADGTVNDVGRPSGQWPHDQPASAQRERVCRRTAS